MKDNFESAYRTYYPLLYSLGYKIVPIHEEVEEIIHEAFLGLWEKKEVLVIQQSLKAYLCKTIYHKALNHKKRVQMLHEHHQIIASGMEESIVLHEMETAERALAVRIEIDKLPTQCRQVFMLSRYDELSQQEIADKLNISIKTVKNHVGKALKVLYENLGNHHLFKILLLSLNFF